MGEKEKEQIMRVFINASTNEQELQSRKVIQTGICRSKTGIPCLWEWGGSYTNKGEAQIIGDRDGNPKKPIFIRQHGELACQEHALIPIRKYDTVIWAERHRECCNIKAYVITEINEETAALTELEHVNSDMVQAAIDKVYSYHCRYPVYILK